VPAALVGFVARDFIKDTLFNPTVVGITLILGGVVFLLVDRKHPTGDEQAMLEQVTIRQALVIGFAQLFALIPGVSRSGASIIGGLVGGLNRYTATAFSFYLAIPVLGGATVLDLVLSFDEIQADDWGMLILGAAVSFVVSLLAIGWLLRYVMRNTFLVFGVYRILAGVVIIGLALAGALA
jgi:undecaprenyl-diphosphatase